MSPSIEWPRAGLDPIMRARVLAASIPSAAAAETVLDAPFADTWAWIEDLPRSAPAFDRDVSSIRIRSQVDRGDRVRDLTATVRTHGVPYPFAIRLEPGFCVMQARARAYLVVMAAAPMPGDPGRTRFVHVEGVPWPGTGFLAPVIERLVRADVRALRRIVAAGLGP